MSNAPTIDAIKVAYGASVDRLLAAGASAFVDECRRLWPRDLPASTTLAEAMSIAAEQGSIDAAAALQALALSFPDADMAVRASSALIAAIKRNPAACAELAEQELIRLFEEAAVDMGMVSRIDPVTGDRRWYLPEERQ